MLVVLTLLLAQPVAPETDLALPIEAEGPFRSYDEVADAVIRFKGRTGGRVYHPVLDPDAQRPTYYFVGRDTTLWLQASDGDMLTLDPYAAYLVGRRVDEEFGYSEFLTSLERTGWGVEDGRFYLYLAQGVPQWLAVAVVVVLPLLVVAALWWMWAGLRRADARRAQLADSRRRIADSRETERVRIALDLHDGPLQDLQTLRMRLGVLQRTADRDASAAGAIQDDLLRVVREIREISEDLRPPVLGPFGLAAAVRTLAGRLREAHPGLVIDLELQSDGTALSDAARLALYRIVQESLNNARAHGRASRVEVVYDESDRGVRLEVRDDGVGFRVPPDLHALEVAGHLGVAGMEERAESIGARLTVESAPGAGTRVLVEAPRSVLSPVPA